MNDENTFRLEQHIDTIMQIMVVGLLAWSLKSNVELTTQMGIVQAKIENLQATVSQGTTDRYRGSDATKDFSAVWAEVARIDARLSRIEMRK